MTPKSLKPVVPSAGVSAMYRKRLNRLIDRMQRSTVYWLSSCFRNNEPELLAEDASPASKLKKATDRLARHWQKQFDKASGKLAKHFAKDVSKRTDKSLKKILKKGGFTVQFKMTAEANDALQAVIAENVALIKSIPSEYFTQVQGSVMRAVSEGRNLSDLTKTLQKRHGITKRRASFIARDQTNKASAVVTRVRQQGMGIQEAIWRHSGGGRHPRPTHVKNNGVPYKVAEGWFDPALNKYIWPGTEPNCRCISRSILRSTKLPVAA